jgi:glycogen phosphorylase
MFDVQIKRIHEYKRQLLNILETIAHWQDRGEPERGLGAAGQDLRRQGRAGLCGGQGNHPPYQRCGEVVNNDPVTAIC